MSWPDPPSSPVAGASALTEDQFRANVDSLARRLEALNEGLPTRRPLWANAPRQSSVPNATGPVTHGLVTPSSVPTAPVHERMLYGVARWPVVWDPKESEQQNQHYGLSFAQASLNLGRRIGQGRHTQFQTVWEECRKWRADYENRFGEKNAAFGKSRQGSQQTFTTPIITEQRYGYLAERIRKHPEARFSTIPIEAQLTTNGPFTPITAQQFTVSASTKLMRGQTVELTQVSTWLQEDGSSLEGPPGVKAQIGHMLHTPLQGGMYATLMQEADDLYRLALRPGQTPAQRLDVLASLHWLLAHAMLDQRGSAAKSELAVRGIALAVGIELPPFARGMVPDLEAFLMSRERFVSWYPTLFDRVPQV